MERKIKLIIFDLGGVVVSPEVEEIPRTMASHTEIEYNQFNDFLAEHKPDLAKGKISLADFYKELVKHFKPRRLDADDIVNKHLEVFKEIIKELNTEVLSVIEELKKNYSVVCLANAEVDVVPLVRKRGVYDYFDKAYISTELGMRKPDPEIYKLILKEFSCKPGEAVFIEDLKENVDSAREIGINSIQYKDFRYFKKEINKLGLLV